MRYNAEEVLAMAERIEKDGAAFYRQAAKLRSGRGKDAAFLLELACMEDTHSERFAAMRERVASSGMEPLEVEPYLQSLLHLDAIADSHGGEGSPGATLLLSGREKLEDILKMAVWLEEKSVAFYLGIREMVPPKMGRKIVDDIIAEEKRHIVVLAGKIKELRKK